MGDPPPSAAAAAPSLTAAAAQATIELFAAYGIALRAEPAGAAPPAPRRSGFLSVGGFVGRSITGYVLLEASRRVLERSNTTSSPPSDWMAELGNQLLGRIKNKMLRAGIALERSPPAIIEGGTTALFTARASDALVTLVGDGDSITVWTVTEPSTQREEEPAAPTSDVLDEGDVVLF